MMPLSGGGGSLVQESETGKHLYLYTWGDCQLSESEPYPGVQHRETDFSALITMNFSCSLPDSP